MKWCVAGFKEQTAGFLFTGSRENNNKAKFMALTYNQVGKDAARKQLLVLSTQ